MVVFIAFSATIIIAIVIAITIIIVISIIINGDDLSTFIVHVDDKSGLKVAFWQFLGIESHV